MAIELTYELGYHVTSGYLLQLAKSVSDCHAPTVASVISVTLMRNGDWTM